MKRSLTLTLCIATTLATPIQAYSWRDYCSYGFKNFFIPTAQKYPLTAAATAASLVAGLAASLYGRTATYKNHVKNDTINVKRSFLRLDIALSMGELETYKKEIQRRLAPNCPEYDSLNRAAIIKNFRAGLVDVNNESLIGDKNMKILDGSIERVRERSYSLMHLLDTLDALIKEEAGTTNLHWLKLGHAKLSDVFNNGENKSAIASLLKKEINQVMETGNTEQFLHDIDAAIEQKKNEKSDNQEIPTPYDWVTPSIVAGYIGATTCASLLVCSMLYGYGQLNPQA